MKLKRKKVGDRSYQLVDARTGTVIAIASQTGEHGRDNYPWSWHLTDDRMLGRLDASAGKSEDSLRNCVDYIESGINQYGLYKSVGRVSGYDVKDGQIFRYAGYYYRALADAHGEFNAYVSVNNHRGDNTEIVIRHEDFVTVYEFETR